MKLRHPQTGAIYETVEHGLVRVSEENGRSGLFHPDGRWHAGELRSADPPRPTCSSIPGSRACAAPWS